MCCSSISGRASKEAQTRELWVYDYRTNIHKTLKTKRLTSADLNDFVECFNKREETERFRRFSYDELVMRDKVNLSIFWLKDDSLEDIDSLPEPDVLAQEIVDNLEAALQHFRGVTDELSEADEVEASVCLTGMTFTRTDIPFRCKVFGQRSETWKSYVFGAALIRGAA